MNADTSLPETRNNQILKWLYGEFYNEDGVKASSSASSHWLEFSRKISVEEGDSGWKSLKGHGFGDLEKGGFAGRVFLYFCTALQRFAHRRRNLSVEIALCRQITGRMGLSFSQDAFRQACTLHLFKQHLHADCEDIVIIGDGYGVLAGLLLETFPKSRVTLIDLGAVLLFQAAGLTKAFPDEGVSLLSGETLIGEESSSRLRLVSAENLAETPLSFRTLSLAVNIASMQEMNPDTVATYFQLLRKHRVELFYCCNRLEKILPDGNISAFFSYPWLPEDEHLVGGPCPWHQWYVGLPVIGAGNLKWGSVAIPFLHRYDGTHWHRLTRLAFPK